MLNAHLRAKVKLRRQLQMTAGMILGQALSYHTNTVVLEADEPCYRRVFH